MVFFLGKMCIFSNIILKHLTINKHNVIQVVQLSDQIYFFKLNGNKSIQPLKNYIDYYRIQINNVVF